MKWVDYREKLGIGFEDNEKFDMLKNKLLNCLDLIDSDHTFYYTNEHYLAYAIMVGELSQGYGGAIALVKFSLAKSTCCLELISKYVAFVNTYKNVERNDYNNNAEALLHFLTRSIEALNMEYELIQDDDGYFIFPKGAPELDEALVSAPLEWLKAYPNAHGSFTKALKDYSEVTEATASDVADKFRKALEAFFQEFFGGGSSLENYKSDYGKYLKKKGVPTEIGGNFETLMQSYTNFMNSYAKHHDKTELNVLEYIMYQTGNIVRLLITLKQEETANAD